MAYAMNSPAYLQETTFYRFEITNYGSDLDSTYLGMYIDPDLGYAFDDYVGCDTLRNLGICFNGDADDGPAASAYGMDPPMIGIDFLRGPTDGMGDPMGMTSFLYFNNDFSNVGNPEIAVHYYRYLKARWKNNDPIVHNGKVVHFMYPGEPNDTAGWSECNPYGTPSDRRFVMGSGPLQVKHSATKTLDFAAIWNRCIPTGACPSFDCIQTVDDAVQAWFDAVYPPVGLQDFPNPMASALKIHPNPAHDLGNCQMVGRTRYRGYSRCV